MISLPISPPALVLSKYSLFFFNLIWVPFIFHNFSFLFHNFHFLLSMTHQFICLFAKEAASAGAKLLCFPEAFSFVGAKDGDSVRIAQPLDGPIMDQYCSLARF
jgi:hypothetical protein